MATDSAIAGQAAEGAPKEERSPIGGFVVMPPLKVQSELLAATTAGGARFKRWALIMGALTLLGVVGLAVKTILFLDDQEKWGYTASMAAFLLTIGGGAPLVAMAPVLAKANWVRPLTRIASIFSLAGVVSIVLIIPLVLVLPPLVTDGVRRRSIWFESPDMTPHVMIFMALGTLLITGLGLVYTLALPDFAAMRDHSVGWRQNFGKRMARGWVGTTVQWRTLRMRIGMFGTFYFLVLIYVHFLFTSDFAMGVVPGWRDAIFPMYHAVSSIQGGIAGVILMAWAARRYLKLEQYLVIDQFWSLGRLLFAASLMWIYFFFSAFIVFWYGRTAADQSFINLLIRGPMVWAFIPGLFLSFIVPWWWLVWNRIRTSVNGPAIGAAIVLLGLLLDRMRIYVTAWSVPPERIHDRFLKKADIPGTIWPDVYEIFIIVGALAAVVLILMLATRVIPVISIWQVQESQLLTKPVKYLRTHGLLIGKPD